jgi:Fe-Mn family superoxide dismutase
VTSLLNQNNPLMDVSPVQGTPLLIIDVWEHAYYLQYLNMPITVIDGMGMIIIMPFSPQTCS